MTLHKLRNPHTLPMIIERTNDGVRAVFPALRCEGRSANEDPWRARDEAILDCARAIVTELEDSREHSGDQR